MAPTTPSRNPMGTPDDCHVDMSANNSSSAAPLTDAFTKGHKKHRRVSKEPVREF